jgi:hypothetical protein
MLFLSNPYTISFMMGDRHYYEDGGRSSEGMGEEIRLLK